MANQRKNNNKMNMNMPRPSMLWIYGLIGAFIIGYYVFGDVNDTPLLNDWTTVEEMVEKGGGEDSGSSTRDQAQVFLKRTQSRKYRRIRRTNDSPPARKRACSSLFTIGSVDSFHRKDLQAAEQSGQTVPVAIKTRPMTGPTF